MNARDAELERAVRVRDWAVRTVETTIARNSLTIGKALQKLSDARSRTEAEAEVNSPRESDTPTEQEESTLKLIVSR